MKKQDQEKNYLMLSLQNNKLGETAFRTSHFREPSTHLEHEHSKPEEDFNEPDDKQTLEKTVRAKNKLRKQEPSKKRKKNAA
jgi:hypothetical protein